MWYIEVPIQGCRNFVNREGVPRECHGKNMVEIRCDSLKTMWPSIWCVISTKCEYCTKIEGAWYIVGPFAGGLDCFILRGVLTGYDFQNMLKVTSWKTTLSRFFLVSRHRGGALHIEGPIPGSRNYVFRERSLMGCDCQNTKRITCPYNKIKGLEVVMSKAKNANLIPIVRRRGTSRKKSQGTKISWMGRGSPGVVTV